MPGDTGAAGRRDSGAVGTHRAARLRAKVSSLLRKIAGMPDYAAYVEHLRRRHPGQRPLTRRQFYDEFVQARYGDGPTRCC
jgi:uncharacterized short protein YbdD (DUF466 family)